uniref:Uncharacterized protein n=1 Tax=Knipowitschia caucasica TaxID=637954 RepID=A0AAV2JPY0_KNICA
MLIPWISWIPGLKLWCRRALTAQTSARPATIASYTAVIYNLHHYAFGNVKLLCAAPCTSLFFWASDGNNSSLQVCHESLPVRSKLLTTSPRSSSQDSLSQPSDNLNNLSLENIVRSNSFTHFKQIPSPSSQPMTRSFSFNRAVELAKPLANTQLRPPRTSLLKPPQLSNGRVGLGMAGLNGDTSEEFLDDFDSSGDVLSDVDLMENSDGQNWPQKLVDDTADWPPPNLAESKDISPMDMSCGSLVLSPESSQAAAGSFIELSPSNSSGGTYMWDEEGLEPIGGSVSHPGDEYEDTDLNSLDLLNNLKPLGATDPEQDDLMLDVELPEDGVHEMSHMEPSERGRLGSRRRHHRWGAPDHFHNSSRVHSFPHYDGFKAPRFSSGPCYSEGKQHIPALELTLDMSQDCSALKSHLLRLQDLLQLEDADSPAEADEAGADDKSTALQELMKEVQDLREELRSRDRTIAQLTLQCQQLQQKQPQQMGHQGRCQCYHQRAPHPVMDKRKQHHHDKATQTHYRPPANTGVLPSPMLSPWQAQAQHQGQSRPSMPPRRHTSNTTAFQPPPQRAAVPGKTNKSSLHRGPQ